MSSKKRDFWECFTDDVFDLSDTPAPPLKKVKLSSSANNHRHPDPAATASKSAVNHGVTDSVHSPHSKQLAKVLGLKKNLLSDLAKLDLIQTESKSDDAHAPLVHHMYNPLLYAWNPHVEYLKLVTAPTKASGMAGTASGKIMLLGMNPGPFGMVQTGVPFGDVESVQSWMKINSENAPIKFNLIPRDQQHPKRPITGYKCHRVEISGSRLYTWARNKFASNNETDSSCSNFFSKFFIYNYCPLYFIANENGKNLPPEKLKKSKEKDSLFQICDAALVEMINIMQPSYVIGIGNFARKRIETVLKRQNLTVDDKTHQIIAIESSGHQSNQNNVLLQRTDFKVGKILHPSPACPQSRFWATVVEKQLTELGVLQ